MDIWWFLNFNLLKNCASIIFDLDAKTTKRLFIKFHTPDESEFINDQRRYKSGGCEVFVKIGELY